MELSDIPIYVYPILFILLVIIVAVVSLFIGKRKFNKDNGIVKEKKVKEPKPPKEGKKLKRKEETAPASFKDEFDSDEDYDNAVESLKSAPAAKPKQKIVEGPVIVVDENKVNEEEVIEWKPPTEEKKAVNEAAAAATPASAAPAAAAAAVAAAPLAEPSEDEWNDEDLELFEARAYSFDEETQSGYVSDKPVAKDETPVEAPVETVYAFREKKEPTRNPEDDEGVQVFETKDEKPEPVVPKAKEEKVSNSKYAYFDSVMEKEKAEAPKETEWQPPQERSAPAPSSDAPAESAPTKKKSGMQYIELDLDEKE
ncbi:hypothetical protein MmiHf6_04320 [Methanimicrococcus hongohii]|uniref:Uncharacterized protein n=1 Tax=Methanimicrococcus hongohii TaxID=3028295 RepID=A0AA96V0Q7_9EURY|nr:hypothetical protein [Methanimicrococcus sp. Hf6]WNY23130.1 hypothetical protein MmiHf6_04320 [Methanimicrococcus sp. Hf6]